MNFGLIEDIACSNLFLAVNNGSQAGKLKNVSWNDIINEIISLKGELEVLRHVVDSISFSYTLLLLSKVLWSFMNYNFEILNSTKLPFSSCVPWNPFGYVSGR